MQTGTSTTGNGLFRQAFFESWLATLCIGIFAGSVLTDGDIKLAGAAILFAAVLAMNGLGKTELFLTNGGPQWWRRLPVLTLFHRITNEGELAGIMVGVCAASALLLWGAHLHVPLSETFTLLGIMSAANIAVRHITPIMAVLERVGGMWLVIVGGSLLSSLTGEPAAAVFLVDYVKGRVSSEEERSRVAVGLGATIGSGGGLMPFAAPPILIIWGILQSTFGWGIADLILWAGLGCVAHVTLSATRFFRVIQHARLERSVPALQKNGVLPLLLLAGLVMCHVLWSHMLWLWAVDIAVGVTAHVLSRKRYAPLLANAADDHTREHLYEERFGAMWQPAILAGLIPALEFIGTVATPLIEWVGSGALVFSNLLPPPYSLLLLAVVLFFVTAWVSHIADNALASRVFIMIPVSLAPTLGNDSSSLLAASVVCGAVFGGFLTIPANLPNFPISRGLRVSAGTWLRASPALYWTCVAYVGWLTLRWLLL